MLEKFIYSADQQLENYESVDLTLLFQYLREGFPAEHPIHQQKNFTLETTPFRLPDGTLIEPKLEPSEIQRRLESICQILNDLRRRHEGRPVYDLSQVFEAYAVIAANFLSIHGCLGWVDGHGRALIKLLPLTLTIAGYGNQYREDQFYDPKTGQFDIRRAKLAIGLLNFHLLAGAKVLAARLELNHGDVSEILRDPRIITDSRKRLSATAHALTVICRNKLK